MNEYSYHGPVDLMLRYGEVPGLTRIAERPGVELEVNHPGLGQVVKVSIGSELRLDLAKGPTSARLQLSDGKVIAGRVVSQLVSGFGFMLIEDQDCSRPTQV
ncbi:hypothetical protein [Pseudomonas sp. PS01297]|uniref:hypothetical protein n=1 Tax=Pseudomonas sp. PS01297 TaxID=2991433 RepID=UPI00249A7C04|nr:hypothetical protein [Pseudomonas sp. PS01297]